MMKMAASMRIILRGKSGVAIRGHSTKTPLRSLSSTTPASTQTHQDHPNPNDIRRTCRGPHGHYWTEYMRSIDDPAGFWSDASTQLEWFRPPTTVLDFDPSNPEGGTRWFVGGEINTCFNALDVHVNSGRGDQVALAYDSPVTGTKRSYTYSELLDEVSRLAGVLVRDFGIKRGDRVVIYMPMIPQSVVAMLACARVGAVHSVVFGGFASRELSTRIDDCKPKIVIAASCGVEPNRIVHYKPLLDKALSLSKHAVEKCIVVQRRDVHECDMVPGRDVDYDDCMSSPGASTPHDAVPLASTDPCYVLYTSGTTGKPKGVVRDTGGYATALKWTMSSFYDTNPGETFWAASDIGWVVGHSYIVYAPLLQGCTTVLYEGKPVGTPDAGAFWRIVQEYGVKTLFTAPTAFRAMKQVDPDASFPREYDLSSLRALFVAGERCDPDTIRWCEDALNYPGTGSGGGGGGDGDGEVVPVIDHWWQTELGWPGTGLCLGLGRMPTRYGACAGPVPGYDVRVMDRDEPGREVDRPGTLGNVCIRLPLPPGTLPSLYNDDANRYVDEYLRPNPGYYTTGDEGLIDDDGYVHILGRTDDEINTAGHRLSTGSIEEVLLDHPDVADCAVIGVNDELKGQLPMGFVVPTKAAAATAEGEEQLCRDLVQRVRDTLGPVASFKKVRVVKGLPKTRSGKILRGTMRKIADGEPYVVTPTIEDATIFDRLAPEIEELVASLGPKDTSRS